MINAQTLNSSIFSFERLEVQDFDLRPQKGNPLDSRNASTAPRTWVVIVLDCETSCGCYLVLFLLGEEGMARVVVDHPSQWPLYNSPPLFSPGRLLFLNLGLVLGKPAIRNRCVSASTLGSVFFLSRASRAVHLSAYHGCQHRL